jgi:uncharacterized protein (DUF488 family)
MELPVIYTVGHSTRSWEQLAALLQEAGIEELVDVRSVPRSRRHPQFNAGALSQSLPRCDIAYAHEPALGGFRRPHAHSPNRGWSHRAFVGYADHMASAEFRAALDRLRRDARERRPCLMCAEAQWWRCHRRLIADALLACGHDVLHLGLGAAPAAHELTPFAELAPDGSITYPPPQPELALQPPAESA